MGDKRIYYSRFNHDKVNPRRNVESVVFEFIGAGHTECLVDGDLLCAFERVHTAIHGEHSLYEMFVRRFRGKMSANDRYYGIRNMLAHNGIKLKENFSERFFSFGGFETVSACREVHEYELGISLALCDYCVCGARLYFARFDIVEKYMDAECVSDDGRMIDRLLENGAVIVHIPSECIDVRTICVYAAHGHECIGILRSEFGLYPIETPAKNKIKKLKKTQKRY